MNSPEKSVQSLCHGSESDQGKSVTESLFRNKTCESVMPTTSLQFPEPKFSGYSDFSSLLFACCKRKDSKEGIQTFELDLNTCPPLLRRTIKIAILKKLENESELEELYL
eukprot:GFUD01051968.1.p1 GENE.GFUD01051968.1~~GFUD01051968.1.p1  ORF type:complete len:110 (+),score=32.20 GFUD01051968.1:131-460(+)